MTATSLAWLPELKTWSADLAKVAHASAESWQELVRLANARVDFVQTGKIDRLTRKLFGAAAPAGVGEVRLAVLASATVEHLLPGLRVGALRRGIHLQTYVCPYGQYRQDLLESNTALHRFAPHAVLFALDAAHMVSRVTPEMNGSNVVAQVELIVDDLCGLWRRARDTFGCQVMQQTVLPVFAAFMGGNEHRLPWSGQHVVALVNQRLRDRADSESVDIIALDAQAAANGIGAWYDPGLWHRAKQEVHLTAGPLYGDLVARVVAAQRGRSFKCLALDLDNTLWGGVIGDDGLEGICLGQGSALGEAYVSFQRYIKALSARGVILAVCSKNDESRALEPFEKHPEMVLRRSDIACFVANWQDKPENLRRIATALNIGIDSIVFADDNPFERNIVRRELPAVGVPELPEDPSHYPYLIASGGYFEATRITQEDTERGELYRQNSARAALQSTSTDLPAYLRSLGMRMLWRRFDRPALQRIHQLINKTNQFNLTTRRYTEAEVGALLNDSSAIALQIRLLDQFGDNGVIAIVIGRRDGADPGSLHIDTWLMSCRVLGRQVEEATLNLLAREAHSAGIHHIVGEYRPTAKNGMVRDHYSKLGFEALGAAGDSPNTSRWQLELERFRPFDTFIATQAEI